MSTTVQGNLCGNPACPYHPHAIRIMYKCILCGVHLHPPAFNPMLEGTCSIFSPVEEDKIQCNSSPCWGTKPIAGEELETGIDEHQDTSSEEASFVPEATVVGTEESVPVKPKQKRNRDIYDYGAAWGNSKGVSLFCSDEDTVAALWELAKQSYGGSIYNGVDWHKKKPHTDKHGVTRTVFRCPFDNQSKCPYQICTLKNTAGTRIYISSYEHDHSKNYKKRGIDLAIKIQAIDSPSKLRKGKFNLVKQAMASSDIILTQAQQTSAHRAILYQTKKFTTQTLGGNLPGQVGGLQHQLEKYKRDGSEGLHDVYLVGSEYICTIDGRNDEHMISAVFSTDNLLCNAIRQMATGVDMTLAIDASHRYNFQGYPVIPIKVIDFSQKAHAVAWAISSKEDVAAHEFIWRVLQRGISNVGRRWGEGKLSFVGREDNDLFVKPEIDKDFCYKPKSVITLIKDSSPAAYTAAVNVFHECLDSSDPPDVIDGACCTHASIRWVANNKKLFKKHSNTVAFMADINDIIKNVPHQNLVETAKKLFATKWEKAGEGKAVKKWMKSWGEAIISRVEMNTVDANPLRGGIPADNNALESTNNQDKAMIGRTKEHVSLQIDSWATNVVRATSKADTAYHSKMKDRSGHCYEKALMNSAFFRRCYQVSKRNTKYGEALFEITYDFASQANGIPPQSFIVFSEQGLQRILKDIEIEQSSVRDIVRHIRRSNEDYVGWYKDLVRNGCDFVDTMNKFGWKSFVTLATMFHVLMPVPGNKTCSEAKENMALRHLMHWLNMNKIPTISAEDLIKREAIDKCWHACTCQKYMHYLLCEHSYAYAFDNKIITGWPTGKLDPRPLPVVSKKKGIRGGQALHKDG